MEIGGVRQGRIVCRLKGGWLLEAPSPDSPRTAKPCGDFPCHPENANSPKSGGPGLLCQIQVIQSVGAFVSFFDQ